MVESIVLYLIGAVAAVYLLVSAYRAIQLFGGAKRAACNTCCSCSSEAAKGDAAKSASDAASTR